MVDNDGENSERNSILRPVIPFNTVRQTVQDLEILNSTPAQLWDKSYMGPILLDSDTCHPSNSSFALGALGGVLIGLGTGFFSTGRIHRPIKLPIPLTRMPRLQKFSIGAIMSTSVLWKITKRAALSSFLFAALECDFRDQLYKNKLYGSMAAAAVSGGIFGLRGGLPGIVLGSSGFSALPVSYKYAFGQIN